MAELLIGARYNSFKEFETVFQQYQRENGILFVKTASKKGIVPRTLLATRLGIAASKKLSVQQREEDKTYARLKKEMRLLESLPTDDASSKSNGEIPFFNHILPLVEDVYWLELKEKNMQRLYDKELLSSQARRFGKKLFIASVSPEDCILKRWFEELTTLKDQQPGLLKSSGKKRSSIHNIQYDAKLSANVYIEFLSFTVLSETVHVGIQLKSNMPCSNKHLLTFSKGSTLSVSSDIHIPELEQTILQSMQDSAPVSKIISHIATHIVNEIAPFVIGLPLKKIKKKKV